MALNLRRKYLSTRAEILRDRFFDLDTRLRMPITRRVGIFVGHEEAFAGLGPAAVFAEAGVSADGADEGIGSRGDGFSLLHDEFKGAARPGGSLLVEAEGAGVAVNHAAVSDLEVIGDHGRPLPVEEALLDGVAVGVLADGAVGFVVAEAYPCLALPVVFGEEVQEGCPDQVVFRERRLGFGIKGFFERRGRLGCERLLVIEGGAGFGIPHGRFVGAPDGFR